MGAPADLIALIDPLPDECEMFAEIFDSVGLQTAIVEPRTAEYAANRVASLGARAVIYRTRPGHRGTTFLRALRSLPSTAGIPVVILTTDPHRVSRDDARAAGASDVLLLPVNPFDIAALAMRLVRESAGTLTSARLDQDMP